MALVRFHEDPAGTAACLYAVLLAGGTCVAVVATDSSVRVSFGAIAVVGVAGLAVIVLGGRPSGRASVAGPTAAADWAGAGDLPYDAS